MNNENLFQNPEQHQEGQTRAVTPVETASRPARRRRSDRYLEEGPAQSEAAVSPAMTQEGYAPAQSIYQRPVQPAAPMTENEPVAPQPQTRVVMPQETMNAVSPRPKALSRAENAAAQASGQEGGAPSAVRRPMGMPPGFTPRQPSPMESMDAPSKSARQTRPTNGNGTGARIPSSAPAGASARRPAMGYDQSVRQNTKKRKSHKWLVALVILLLLAGLAMVALMVLGENDDGVIGQVYDKVSNLWGDRDEEAAVAASASGFTAAIDRGTAPMDVVFNLTTSKSVSEVRLVNEDGQPLEAVSVPVTENADSIIWMLSLPVNDGYEGLVLAQIYDGTQWLDTGRSQQLEISMPLPTSTVDVAAFIEATDEPTATPDPTDEPDASDEINPINDFNPLDVLDETDPMDDPYGEFEPFDPYDEFADLPSDEPWEPFEDEPSEEVTATPTLAVTDTPAIAPAATITPVPAELAATQIPMSMAEATETPAPEVTEPPVEETAEPDVAPVDEPDEPEPTEAPTPTEQPTATPPLIAMAANSADPSLIKDTVIYNGNNKIDSYSRERALNMPVGDSYLTQPYGVLTYRGNAFRQNAAVGTVGDIGELVVAWRADAGSAKGSSSTYYGIGWTGQPAIIKWSKEVRAATNIGTDKKNTTALKEVIIAGMDGNIYFLDLADGQATRKPINLGFPMRGTPSLHPLGYPIMAVGQYGRKMASGSGDIGLRVYNLLNQKQAFFIDGLDGKAKRPYYEVGAFDTSALIDPNTDTLVAIGTNGMLYTAPLNTEYSVMEEKVTINPSLVSMKSRISKQANKYTAVQSSPAMYGNYVYYADMQGILRCVNTTTMTTVWAVDTGDAVEAAIALDLDDNGDLWLYTANTLEVRKKGDCSIRRYNALTGEQDWVHPVNVASAKSDKTPGAMASPVVGQYELSDLVYFTLSNVSAAGAADLRQGESALPGVVIALDKNTGDVRWSVPLGSYSYSSPVAVYTEQGTGYIIQASSKGSIMLLDGLTGSIIDTLEVEGTLDASPAVYNDMLVIGTTGKNTTYIYGIKLQ